MRDLVWYVINLDSEVERYASVENESKSFGINMTRVPAVESRAITDLKGHYVTSGVRAAWLSHLKAIQLFLSSDKDYAIIAEDDFHILKPRKLRKLLDFESTFDFDLLQIGFLLPGIDTVLRACLSSAQKALFRAASNLSGFPAFKMFDLQKRMRVREARTAPKGITMFDCLPGAHCYLISRNMAKAMLDLNSPQFLSIDDFYSALSKMRAFRMGRTTRSLVSQLPFEPWAGDRFKNS